MTYSEAVENLATETEQQLDGLWARHQAGDLTREEFVALAAALLVQADARGTALGDIGLAATLTVATATFTVPFGLGLAAERVNQLRRAVLTMLLGVDALDPDYEAEQRAGRVQRLARAVAMDAPQRAWGQGIRKHGVPWTRRTTDSSCDTCQRLADGTVFPAERHMFRHPQCDCIQQPVANQGGRS